MALGTPQPSPINSTLTGPKDSGSGSPGGDATTPAMNQGRISGMLPMSEGSDLNKMESPYNSAISGNLAGTTDTGGSDANAPASFQGITVEPPHLPPGAVPAANEQP